MALLALQQLYERRTKNEPIPTKVRGSRYFMPLGQFLKVALSFSRKLHTLNNINEFLMVLSSLFFSHITLVIVLALFNH